MRATIHVTLVRAQAWSIAAARLFCTCTSWAWQASAGWPAEPAHMNATRLESALHPRAPPPVTLQSTASQLPPPQLQERKKEKMANAAGHGGTNPEQLAAMANLILQLCTETATEMQP